MKFRLGRLVATPDALDVLAARQMTAFDLLQRHQTGDWGDIGTDDKRANEAALVVGGRIFSAYMVNDTKIYCITEHDRSSTCLLLASEY